MLSDRHSHLLTTLIAAAYLLGVVLTALNWRQVVDLANRVRPILVLIALLYLV